MPGSKAIESYWKISHTPVFNAAGQLIYFIHDINKVTAQVISAQQLKESLELEKQMATKANLLGNQMRQLFDDIPAQVAIVKGEEMIYDYVNPAYEKEMGQGDGLIGRKVLEVMPDVRGMPIWEVLQQTCHEGRSFIEKEIEIPLPGAVGEEMESRYFNLVYQPFRDAQGTITGVLSFKYEITDYVAARKNTSLSACRTMVWASTRVM